VKRELDGSIRRFKARLVA